jgi:hypothetical protein
MLLGFWSAIEGGAEWFNRTAAAMAAASATSVMPSRDRRRETATFNFKTSVYRLGGQPGNSERPSGGGILCANRCPRCDREVARA